ncbi:hypothetical protein ACI797_12765 [Geodermatophilus sp. SYSU D00691]
MTALALLAALAAMLSNSAASLLESDGSRRAAAGRPVWRQPRYLVGLVLDAAGWLLSVVALRFLPVFAVQAVLAGTVPVTAAAASRGLRGWSRARLLALAGVVLGIALVAAAAAPGRAPRRPAPATPVLLAAAGVLVLAAVPLLRSGRPLALAGAAGAAFGGVSLAVRAVHVRSAGWSSVLELLAEPLAYAVVVFGATGTVLLARALRAGAVAAVVAVLTVTEVVLPGLVGLALLGDRVRPGWAPALVAGWLLTVAAVVVLARTPAGGRVGTR